MARDVAPIFADIDGMGRPTSSSRTSRRTCGSGSPTWTRPSATPP